MVGERRGGSLWDRAVSRAIHRLGSTWTRIGYEVDFVRLITDIQASTIHQRDQNATSQLSVTINQYLPSSTRTPRQPPCPPLGRSQAWHTPWGHPDSHQPMQQPPPSRPLETHLEAPGRVDDHVLRARQELGDALQHLPAWLEHDACIALARDPRFERCPPWEGISQAAPERPDSLCGVEVLPVSVPHVSSSRQWRGDRRNTYIGDSPAHRVSAGLCYISAYPPYLGADTTRAEAQWQYSSSAWANVLSPTIVT